MPEKQNRKDEGQNEVLQAIQFALKMESDGKDFYLKASRNSSNDTGKELFAHLAAEEEKHQQTFQQIFREVQEKRSWSLIKPAAGNVSLMTVFTRKARLTNPKNITAGAAELAAIDLALNMEDQSVKFYQEQTGKPLHTAGKDFYRSLAEEERGHYLTLIDYREYLTNPAEWLADKERPSLDGA